MAGWWQADQFDWFSSYLHDRGLQPQWRMATFVFTLVLAMLPLIMLGSPLGPNHTVTVVVAIGSGVSGVAASGLWLFRWPSRTQSIVFNAVCSVCTAATCLALSSAYAGLMGCTVFAVIGGFLAYFHAIAHVLANFGVAAVTAAITATRLATDTGDLALTAAAVLTVTAVNVGVPFGVHSFVHSLRIDLRNTDRDPLTGLLNRREFYNAVHEMIRAQTHPADARLNITMIDLDDFKRLNDTRGHAVGDEALAGVAEVLRHSAGTRAVLCRLGGEEFVIADTEAAERNGETAEHIRAGVAALPFGITASIGTCSATMPVGTPFVTPQFVDALIRLADEAMYQSKRAGGNGVRRRHVDRLGAP